MDMNKKRCQAEKLSRSWTILMVQGERRTNMCSDFIDCKTTKNIKEIFKEKL
jgi:hypothetical protein